MGELISLREWLAARPGSVAAPAQQVASSARAVQFIYDLSCPLSYLAAEQIEQSLGEVAWVPAAAGVRDPDAVRGDATRRARALRLPLVWPERYPQPLPRASRAAAHAEMVGSGARFALAALRLAFCGGFDLEDPLVLAEAAAAAGMGVEECLAAAENPELDARLVPPPGASRLPAIQVGGRVFDGDQALLHPRVPAPGADSSTRPA